MSYKKPEEILQPPNSILKKVTVLYDEGKRQAAVYKFFYEKNDRKILCIR